MTDDGRPKARIAEPQRRQSVIRFEMPEDTLPPAHPARVLWDVIVTLDLGAFLVGVKAVDGTVGRKTLSPAMKLVLWLYAISKGVGSAREIARRVRSDDGYRWIVGDLEVSHNTLSSFRVGHGAALDELMTDILVALIHKGVLSLDLVAQDGIRIRAAATAPSFRRRESLLECREQAALHLKATLARRRSGDHTRPAGRLRSRSPRFPASCRGGDLDGHGAAEDAQAVRKTCARIDDGRRGARDEDGRRRLPSRVQRPHGDGRIAARRPPDDRRRTSHERRQRHGLDHTNARADRAANGSVAEHAAR